MAETVKHRIRELRDERNWTFDRLAEEVSRGLGKPTTAGTMQKLEAGDMQLTLTWMERIAKAFGVRVKDLLEEPEPEALREDAEPYIPAPGERLPTPPKVATPGHFMVKTQRLDELGIMPGDVAIFDMHPAAVNSISHGDVVIAQLYDDRRVGPTSAKTILREFIEPRLLITNSKRDNAPILNTETAPVQIKGVVRAFYRPEFRPRPRHAAS